MERRRENSFLAGLFNIDTDQLDFGLGVPSP